MAGSSDFVKVIDSSFVLCYLMPDEKDAQVQAIFDEYEAGKLKLISTFLLPFEVLNGLYAATVSKRIDLRLAKRLTAEFLIFPIKLVGVDYLETLSIAHRHSLTVYDASYLWLAKQKKLPLLTLDSHFKKLVKRNS